jgi:catalase
MGLGIVVDARGAPSSDEESPALSMVTDEVFPPDGRVVHILANDGADLAGIAALQDALLEAGAAPHVIATHKGAIAGTGDGPAELTVDRSFHTASSAEADAVVVAGNAGLTDEPAARTYVESTYRHHKTIGAWGDGAELLQRCSVDPGEPGIVVTDASTADLADALISELGRHRHWERVPPHPTRSTPGAD